MKPQLLTAHIGGGTHHAFLVDAHSVTVRVEDGRERTHYASAISLRACMAGQVEVAQPDATGAMLIVAPSPCVLAMRKAMKSVPLDARGIDPMAAEVMLRLVASAQNIQAPFNGSMTWTFGEPVQRSDDPAIMAGTTPAKFIAAWKWSHWQRNRFTGAQRLADMQRIGYRGTAAALRDMMSNLGLVATKRR